MGIASFHLCGIMVCIMFIRQKTKKIKGKTYAYWELVESYRTAKGPRQRTVAHLGLLDEKIRNGVLNTARGKRKSVPYLTLFEMEDTPPEWVEIDVANVRTENEKRFGGVWLAIHLMKLLGLDSFLQETIPVGREDVSWALMAMVLVICRFCEPSSELHIAESFYRTSAIPELLGIPADKIYDERLYRALDKLHPHKQSLEKFLKDKLGTLFDIEYDLLLYDVTSTYYEGLANGNPLAKYGYSRDHRSDCKQVCIGLVVTRDGIPLGYEVFAGNTHDSKTYQQIVTKMESQYGKANRVWCTDRGMMNKENIAFLQQEGRRYIIGTPKASLRNYERELLNGGWKEIREGVEVKLCPTPDGEEMYILCRSRSRQEKEKAMHDRFVKRMTTDLEKLQSSCEKRKYKKEIIDQRIGRLKTKNSRGAGLFEIQSQETPEGTRVTWTRNEQWQDWASCSEGCYMLRTNIMDWTESELWDAYIQLTEAEGAFCITKNDLSIRPIWHQLQHRMESHILVCFLAYVLWKTLGQMTKRARLGDEPRRVIEELGRISMVDVVLPTHNGIEIRRTCITAPTDHQEILLQHLNISLPKRLRKEMTQM